METTELQSWIRLVNVSGIGPANFRKLLHKYGSATRAIQELPRLFELYPKEASVIPAVDYAEAQIEQAQNHNAKLLTWMDSEYPAQLHLLYAPPPLVYAQGDLSLLYQSSLAVVGSRQASLNGIKFTQNLCKDLGKSGAVIISGLATGIDTAAHRGSMETGTIAVLGGGLDINYPQENAGLQTEISQRGLVLSEFPFGTPPSAHHFPRRNRILAALSQGTLVVEAKYPSGSMITAQHALELGKDVFAVPGFPYDPRSEGPNQLIRDGAILVRSAQDILEVLGSASSSQGFEEFNPKDYFDPPGPEAKKIHEMREKILELLSTSPTSIDAIIEETGFSNGYVWEIILDLELADRIQRHPHNKISLKL